MKIIITESQLKEVAEVQMLMESIFEAESIDEFKKEVRKLVRRLLLSGVAIASIYSIISNYCDKNNVPQDVKKQAIETVSEIKNDTTADIKKNEPIVNKKKNDWKLVDSHTLATVYNAIPAQCNGDFGHTASMFTLNLDDVLSHRIIAMERTFMAKLGLKYGDIVKIKGTNGYDGVWQIQDTMNKRYKGMNKIDILVPNNITKGQWDNVKIYKLTDLSLKGKYMSNMAGEISEKLNKKQMERIRKELEAKKKMKQNNKRPKK